MNNLSTPSIGLDPKLLLLGVVFSALIWPLPLSAQTAPNQTETPPVDATTSPAQDLLEEELAEAMATQEAESSTGAAAFSNLFNPAISVNALVLMSFSFRGDDGHEHHDHGHEEEGEEEHEEEGHDVHEGHDDHEGHGHSLGTGIHLQEVELKFSSVVDPYFRADFVLAAHGGHLGFEEAFLSTTSIPRMTIRAGQMYANIGRHNLLHTHAYQFVNAPLPWPELLGPEGLNDVGVSFDILFPLPFFAEINAQVFQGEWASLSGDITDDPATSADESSPDQREDSDLGYVGHLKTLFELSDSATIELGGTYAGGRNGFGGWTHMMGSDLTLKWRPIQAERYTSLEWTTEYLLVNREGDPESDREGGGYTGLRYQFNQRWWVQARAAVLGLPQGDEDPHLRNEALLAFIPSEYSGFRLQYAFEPGDSDHEEGPLHEIFLQAIISIGSHPTHAY